MPSHNRTKKPVAHAIEHAVATTKTRKQKRRQDKPPCEEHGYKDKYMCPKCPLELATGRCEHGNKKTQCKQCGTGICEHGNWKTGACAECGRLSWTQRRAQRMEQEAAQMRSGEVMQRARQAIEAGQLVKLQNQVVNLEDELRGTKESLADLQKTLMFTKIDLKQAKSAAREANDMMAEMAGLLAEVAPEKAKTYLDNYEENVRLRAVETAALKRSRGEANPGY